MANLQYLAMAKHWPHDHPLSIQKYPKAASSLDDAPYVNYSDYSFWWRVGDEVA